MLNFVFKRKTIYFYSILTQLDFIQPCKFNYCIYYCFSLFKSIENYF
jgi:hypothetical protein